MNRVDAHYRSLFKSITWRICASLSTILIVFAFTHKIVLSLGIGAVEVIVKLILYYFHERIWEKVPMGKRVRKLNSVQEPQHYDSGEVT